MGSAYSPSTDSQKKGNAWPGPAYSRTMALPNLGVFAAPLTLIQWRTLLLNGVIVPLLPLEVG